MVTYNGSRFLCDQVNSVLAELRDNDELVVIDDASEDSTIEILDKFISEKINVLRNASNQGVRKSFERGLVLAKHRVVFLCDQDDIWLPGKRKAIVDTFESDPRVSVVLSDAQLIDENGRVTAQSFMAQRGGFAGGFWSTLHKNRFLGCAMAVRRDILDDALPIPPGVPMHDMWLGIVAGACGTVRFLPQPLIQYRRHSNNVTPMKRRSLSMVIQDRIALLMASAPRLLALRWRRRNVKNTDNDK
jgi:GT2 family glycosyltransferase